MFDLTGKTALVTGASGGIGGEVARALYAAGAKVALSGTRIEPLQARVGIGQRFQFDGQQVAMRGELVRRNTVLAREILHPHQLAFDLLQCVGIQIEVVADAFEQGQRFIQLDRGRVQHRVHVVQSRFVACFALQSRTQVLQLRA